MVVPGVVVKLEQCWAAIEVPAHDKFGLHKLVEHTVDRSKAKLNATGGD